MIDQHPKTMAFRLKGRLYTLMVMQLSSVTLEDLEAEVEQAIHQAPKLFESTPLVLDCSELETLPPNMAEILFFLKKRAVFVVALQGSHSWIREYAAQAGLALLNASSTQDKPIQQTKISQPVTPQPTKCHAMPVRSGQQLVAKGTDLLVLGTVSPGAELLSEGHIHVYGALKGRALAGMSGDRTARIFCQSLDAELVAIAGVYRLSESMSPISKPCQIFLSGDKIMIEPLCQTT